ncbi:MAG TPA: murein L,D-transpeptidase [Alphaproteobacteria bacterium]|nr:murein L,D-transpeptidase [Alphaproteobacteria bacterium]
MGRVPPPHAGFEVVPQAEAHDLVADVAALAQTDDIEAALDAMDPPFVAYGLLEVALARYRPLARDPSLTVELSDRIVRAGDALPEAAALRRRLRATGDLREAPDTPRPGLYDATLAVGVRRFQRRHGLAPDGILGPNTAAALAVPLAERVRQIEFALERFRWLPHRFASPPIAVNIPELRLFAVREKDGRYVRSDEDLSMRVIVGEAWERQTPVFHSDLQRIVFWPYWHVPSSIVREEMLPATLLDPGYLERQHLEIVARYGADETLPPSPDNLARLGRDELRLRQRPGRHNALGLVKFLLPNPYRVYLHGTPEPWLFDEERRALSHGCIRVEDPLALARYVLRDEPGWTPARIERALAGPDTLEVDVTRPIPVYVLYVTAVSRPDGSVHFFEDLYGLDSWLRILLDGIPPDDARACSDATPHCAYGSLASQSASSP